MEIYSGINPGSSSTSESNEDLFGQVERAAWVLDGTSGFTGKKVSKSPSDGRWYVERFNDYLEGSDISNLDKKIGKVLEGGVKSVSEEFNELIEKSRYNSYNHEELPSANLAGVRWDEDQVEVFVLGDCTALIRTEEGIEKIRQEEQVKMDDKVIKEIGRLMEEGYSHGEAMNEVEENLIEDEKQRNKRYFSLGHVPTAVRNVSISSYSKSSVDSILLYTDGFEQLHNYFEVCEEGLIEYVEKKGVEGSIEELRYFENERDPECSEFPRFKKSDDAAVIHIVN